ncbi:MAG: phosphopantetheine-binding protein [Erysipelotrichaceae bacterium]|nr:phosphopantetheine-binding protein [Erysipelotrichaceae bacterium]MDD3923688.1 phosphopantetheine-binding protein [Erysipelotrichaceae bacterium]MDD4642067.1 phosphopantetheine-binding protein [Erysipelotrichaceae bacterium]
MLTTIQNIITEIIGHKTITLETDFIKDLELSSFDIVNIISAVEDKYDIVIPTRDIWNIHQVKDAIAYLRDHGINE